MDSKYIRNFSIIAHIDHGKSTLADRLLEYTGTVTAREMQSQVLDDMDLERERGITIKAHAVRLLYKAEDGRQYELNLIDTPGHVDFSSEVSRSLAACEGALIIVDAAQGVEAQTLANYYLALEQDLSLIPVINKIDLPNAEIPRVRHQLQETLGFGSDEIILTSAKEGIGTQAVLEAIVKYVPPPQGGIDEPLRALIFDSFFDAYQGAVVFVRLFEGRIRPGMKIRFISSDKAYEVTQVGVFTPKMRPVDELCAGEVGYVSAAIKHVRDVRIGDTLMEEGRPATRSCRGYQRVKPMVFCGLYPTQTTQYDALRAALDKLSLNDASFTYEPETSLALGFGFRCGFLGLLHLEIIQERLEREFGLSLLTTSPTVVYHITTQEGKLIQVDNPAQLPSPDQIIKMEEPVVQATIVVPQEYLGGIMRLLQEKRGAQKSLEYLDSATVMITYRLPLAEMITDFYDRLKSVSRGYASFDYDLMGFTPGDLVKLDILLNGQPVDALSCIVHKEKAYHQGRKLVERLKAAIPRQLYMVVIQCAIGSRIIARETIRPLRKDVIAKCYGGDITRKRKLLEKQKAGKKRMKQLGNVEIPQEAFMTMLKLD